MTGYFGTDEARRFYDAFGARQDSQGFYEDAALDSLVAHGRFGEAQAVLEIGCGTGRFALRLLEEELPASARYAGIDLSATMVELARVRLSSFGARADIRLSDGGFDLSALGGPFDRVVATYVFDLMSEADMGSALAAAHGALAPGGLLCACGLTHGPGGMSRITSAAWGFVHGLKPSLVGGCRPIDLVSRLATGHWRVMHRSVVVAMTVPSEVLVAEAV